MSLARIIIFLNQSLRSILELEFIAHPYLINDRVFLNF